MNKKISIDEYDLGRVIGQGQFGRVMFATEKATGKIVAVKEVGMEQISKAGLEEHIFREKNIMKELKGHPFMIDLIETTKDEKNLYFISEICTGGNLFELVDFRNKLSLQVTKAYAAQIASILAHLQQHGITHRDLKPQNIMIDSEHNIKLIDFGEAVKLTLQKKKEEANDYIQDFNVDANTMYSHPDVNSIPSTPLEHAVPRHSINAVQDDFQFSKVNAERRGTLAGTLNYMAPEMISEAKATLSTDMWAFGCIIYKMITGRVTFPGVAPTTVYPRVQGREINWPKGPQEIDPVCRDLIEQLLCLDPDQRLGTPSTINDLFNHPFFDGIDFSKDLKSQMNLEKLLKDSETEEIRKKQYEIDELLKPALLQVKENEPVLSGIMMKRNRFGMEQARNFRLYRNGQITYFHNQEPKGTMHLQMNQRCIKHGARSVNLRVTSQKSLASKQSCLGSCFSCICCKKQGRFDISKKQYELIQMKNIKTQEKTDRYSCDIDDWVEAINLVVSEITVSEQIHLQKQRRLSEAAKSLHD